MDDKHDLELRAAVAEGILSREDAAALADEARLRGRSPLDLLVERGRLSEETFASLRANAQLGATPRDDDPDEAAVAPRDRDAGAPVFPVAAWDRFQCVKFLGQGAMGQVFLARDPRLRRDVAIKLVRGDDPEHMRRLVAEARAQARVDHERVCKVHEVGEVEGRVYIAMQYIDGEPLGALAGELNLERKAMLVRGAALGVHEAHRAGIIHRDIKPSNIMVERTGDGELRPYVMDFGLARSFQEGGTTMTGAVLGTPRYMAPEQACGKAGELDRRADIYSLGATLYHLLTGEPPTPGNNMLEVLSNLATLEPRAPRALDPGIPLDLEAIVLKCLEKDRSARYDSARALADDLERFLNGEPVLARSAGRWYGLRRRIRRHRRLVTAAAVALALVLSALSWGIKARHEASERERLARRFTELVEHIEATARYSALSPLHDIRSDQKAIKAKMDQLDAEIHKTGAVASGPGHYAMGRGFLALGDEARAGEHLEAAWQSGFRQPRAAYALALVMGRRYRRALREAERIRHAEQREARKREIERKHRDPALAYLRQSEGADVPSTAYVAALIAFYEDRLDDALGQLDDVGSTLPWFYEAAELRGDILLARALRRRVRADQEGAMDDIAAGRRAYAAAVAIAESVPEVRASMGELEFTAMITEIYGKGDIQSSFERGVEAVKRALEVMPDHRDSLLLEARLHRVMAEHGVNQGSDVEDLLRRAVAAAQRAVELDPARPDASLELARDYRQWAQARQARNVDPREQLRRAVEISEGIRPEERDCDYHVLLGSIYKVWSEYEAQGGVDPRPDQARAIEGYRSALRLDERRPDVWMNLGIVYYSRASDPRGDDTDGDLERATAALQKARAQSPKHVVPYHYGGEIHLLSATRKRARGGDARPDLGRALLLYREGIEANPSLSHLYNGLGSALLEQAREAWDRGGDPDPSLDEARAAFERAITVAPDQGFGQHNVGEVLAQRAWYRRAGGGDPGAATREAIPVIQEATRKIPEHAGPWSNLGMVYSIQASFELSKGGDPTGSLARAAAALDSALRRNPNHAQSHFYMGETRATQALSRARRSDAREEHFEEAERSFQRALELTPEDQHRAVAFGLFYCAWASWQKATGRDPGPSIRHGLRLADRVLAARPGWPDARVLRARLLLLQAVTAERPAERRALAAEAGDDLDGALTTNENLTAAWRDETARARALAAPSP